MIKRFLFLCLALFFLNAAQAQTSFSGWFQYASDYKISKKFSVHFDGHLRSTDRLHHVSTLLLRPGVNYAFTKRLLFTLGYGLVHRRETKGAVAGYFTEHRIWQQLQYNASLRNIVSASRLRFEERYIPVTTINGNSLSRTGFGHAYRIRYQVRNVIPLKRGALTKGAFFSLQDELFINTGDKTFVNGKSFEQNRFFSGLGYRFTSKIDMDLGYMNQYIKTANSYSRNHIVQLNVYKRL